MTQRRLEYRGLLVGLLLLLSIGPGGPVALASSVGTTVRQSYDGVGEAVISTKAEELASAGGMEEWGWSWVYPETRPNDLSPMWGSGPDDLFLVGSDGSILHYDGYAWSPMSSGVTTGLNGIWGSGPDDVYAVGYTGTILHYDGVLWSTACSGSTATLYAVWGSSATDIFAVGEDGTILHFDGDNWSIMPSDTSAHLVSIWGSSSNDVFAVGSGATVLHYDGDSWSSMSSGVNGMLDLNGVWGSSGKDVYAVGAYGAACHYDGTVWSPVNPGVAAPLNLNAVWGSSSSNVYVAGTGGLILQFDGSSWIQSPNITTTDLVGIWGDAPDNVYLVGSYADVFRYDGLSWSQSRTGDTPPSTGVLMDVHGTSSQDIYVVGVGGTIVVYDGTAWSAMDSGVPALLYGVWANSSTDVFAGGESGTLLHYDGTAWSSMAHTATQNIYGLWGSSSTNVFAVDAWGSVHHYDGANWSVSSSDLAMNLMDLWGVTASDIYAVGFYGDILHFDGTTWTEMAIDQLLTATDVWGASHSDVFAVGMYGEIAHYNGDYWHRMDSGTTATLLGVWGTSGTDVFAVGADGTMLHYDGNAWSRVAVVTTMDLRAVWGDGEAIYVVGEQGVWRYGPQDSGTYVIEGQVLGPAGTGLAGVTVTAACYTVDTDAEGLYELANIAPGRYLVTPARAGYEFSPSQLEVTVPPSAADANFVGTMPSKPWLVMYYLAGDNTADASARSILDQLTSITNPEYYNLAIMHDPADGASRYYYIADNSTYIEKGELDSGSPETLVDFATWAMGLFPTEYTMLVLYDHGGLPGVSQDVPQSSLIAPNELGAAFRQIVQSQGKIDVVFMYTCLSGSIDMAYELAESVDWYVASENTITEVFGSSYYLDYLNVIDADREPESLAFWVARSFALKLRYYYPYTISVARMDQMPALVQAINALASLLDEAMASGAAAWLQGSVLPQVQRFDSNEPIAELDQNDELLDLHDFARLVSIYAPDSETEETAAEVMRMIADDPVPGNRYIQYEDHWSRSPYDLERSHGVSGFWPMPDRLRSFYTGDLISYAAGTVWTSARDGSALSAVELPLSTWGPMLVGYVNTAYPDAIDDPLPPPLVAPIELSPSEVVFLPLTIRN